MDKDVKQAKLHNALERAKDAVNFAWESGYRRGMEAMRGAAFDAWMNGDKRRGWQPFEEAAARLLEGAKHE